MQTRQGNLLKVIHSLSELLYVFVIFRLLRELLLHSKLTVPELHMATH